jgi:hypothetical protein
MKYDYKVERMPDYRFSSERRDDKHRRIWQVVMIERDEMGAPGKDIRVHRNGLTYDEATSAWNALVQELRKMEWEKEKGGNDHA